MSSSSTCSHRWAQPRQARVDRAAPVVGADLVRAPVVPAVLQRAGRGLVVRVGDVEKAVPRPCSSADRAPTRASRGPRRRTPPSAGRRASLASRPGRRRTATRSRSWWPRRPGRRGRSAPRYGFEVPPHRRALEPRGQFDLGGRGRGGQNETHQCSGQRGEGTQHASNRTLAAQEHHLEIRWLDGCSPLDGGELTLSGPRGRRRCSVRALVLADLLDAVVVGLAERRARTSATVSSS